MVETVAFDRMKASVADSVEAVEPPLATEMEAKVGAPRPSAS